MTEPSKQSNKINIPSPSSTPLPSSAFTTPAKPKQKLNKLQTNSESLLSTVNETENEFEQDESNQQSDQQDELNINNNNNNNNNNNIQSESSNEIDINEM